MSRVDRARMMVAVAIALLAHAIAFTAITVFAGAYVPYPEMEPLFVTLEDYDPLPPEPPPPPPPAEIGRPPDPSPVVPAPAPPQPAPEAPQPAPAPRPAPQPAPAPRSTDAPPGAIADQPLIGIPSTSAADREADRMPDSVVFGPGSDIPAEPQTDLPAWVVSGEVSVRPIDSLSASERRGLQERAATLPGFDATLRALEAALRSPVSPASQPGPGGDGTTVSRQQLPGDAAIDWIGSGSRTVLQSPLPQIVAQDLGGQVPAWIDYIVVFDVDSAGTVVPGSLIFRQNSGYTAADQKVREAIQRWQFEQAPGSPRVTAIATLRITRDRIR